MAPFFDLCPSSPKQYFLQTSHTKSLLLLSRPSPKGYQKRVKKKTPSRTLQKTAWSTKKPLKQTPKVFQKSLNFGSLFFWPLLGPTWASLVPSWPVWVPILPPSSPILDHLGTNLGLSCALLVPILPHLAANLSQLGPFGAHVAPFGGQLEPTWAFWCSSCPILVHLLANLQVHSHMCWSILSMSSLSFKKLVASLTCQTPRGRRCRAGRVLQ